MDVEEALEMLQEYQDGWSEIYEKAKDDLEFALIDGNQWDKKDRKTREDADRPCIEVNVLPQFIHQVTNQIRQKTPSINFLPAGEGTSIEAAKIRKGLARNIEYRSGADEVYDTSAEYAVTCGIGFIRVDHDYVSPDSWDQELLLKREPNPLTCWIDPSSMECDGSDAEGAIRLETWTKARFEKEYPGKDFVSFEAGAMADDKRKAITLAEIFVKEYETVEKAKGEDGSFVEPKEGEKGRKLRKVVIKRYLFSGADRLESTTFPGEYIPVVPVFGQELWADGKRHLISLVRNAKDPQRRYNHWASVEAELLSKAPKSPFIAEFDSIDDFKEEWEDPDAVEVLRWKRSGADGNAERPYRLPPIQPNSGIINAMQGAYEDIKRAMGLYDASVGQKSNETSGIAIENRKEQGNTATFHFEDNLVRSITQVGRILNCAMPIVYDTARIIQIIGEEDEPELVGVNGMMMPDQKDQYDLTKGKYDVRVITGPSYTTKRQEVGAKLGELIAARPELLGVFGDLWAKHLDIPNAEAMAARIKKTIPPELVEGEDGEQATTPREQQLMQAVQQQQQQMQEMGQALQQAEAAAQDKQADMAKVQMDAQSKSQDMQMKEQELQLKQQEMQFKMSIEQRKAENEAMKLQLEAEKLEIERMKLSQPPPQDANMSTPPAFKLDTEGFNFVRSPEEEQRMAMEAEAQAQREAEEREEKEMERAEREIERAERRAAIQALLSIAEGVSALNRHVGAPMEVIRDGNGMIVGSKPMTMN